MHIKDAEWSKTFLIKEKKIGSKGTFQYFMKIKK